ncbi:hypothetical protein HK104_007135 [Borealophlyctis nickersoniae]|nr:hypothetical protein HK104_007135 [Borealophlyctis nickersoniae]
MEGCQYTPTPEDVEIGQAWEFALGYATSALAVPLTSDALPHVNEAKLAHALNVLQTFELSGSLLELVVGSAYTGIIEKHFDAVLDEFIPIMTEGYKAEPGSTEFSKSIFIELVRLVNNTCRFYDRLMEKLQFRNEIPTLRGFLQTALVHKLPRCFPEITRGYFGSFTQIENGMEKRMLRDGSPSSGIAAMDITGDDFGDMCIMMEDIGLTEVTTPTFIEMLKHQMVIKVREAHGDFHEARLGAIVRWFDTVIVDLLRSFMRASREGKCTILETQLRSRLYREFGLMRISEMFDIIKDCAIEKDESNQAKAHPALDDLKICLSKASLKRQLVKQLGEMFEQRLLHMGVVTMQILEIYIEGIKCLRILDPSGSLAVEIMAPVRRYLRKRPDCIGDILTLLLENSDSLSESLADEGAVVDDEDFDNDNWMPESLDAVGSRKERLADIFNSLLSIHDSRESYVKQFETQLAERLLKLTDYNTDNDIANVELLTAKFGEHEFDTCRVMIKDVVQSKTADDHIHQQDGILPELHALVISDRYWTNVPDERLNLPIHIQRAMDDYAKAFGNWKHRRRLDWKPTLGNVELELDFGKNGKRTFNVTPGEATTIIYFSENHHETWTLMDLSEEMGIPPEQLLPYLRRWVAEGILEETEDETFRLTDGSQKASDASRLVAMDIDQPAAAAPPPMEAEWLPAYAMIHHMLQQQGPKTPQFIHSLLGMMMTGFTKSVDELNAFLMRKAQAGELRRGMDGTFAVCES